MASLSEREQQSVELVGELVLHLSEGQTLQHVGFRGRSMMPMLRQGVDTVELARAPKQLRKYDLPMYIGPRGKYVMHRIIGVDGDGYICRGDNTYSLEKVQRVQIVAVVVAFHRGNRRIVVDAKGYQLYCRVWCAIYPLRKCCRDMKNWLRRLLK